MSRMHDRESFYKYVSSETAIKVLESRKFRWSSPVLFNDPFDHKVTYQLAFSEEDAINKLLEVIEGVIFGREPSVFVENTPLAVLSKMIRDNPLKGQDKEYILDELNGAAKKMVGRLPKYQSKLNQELLLFLEHSRVFCVSETNDNLVMWSHYADQHRGAVMKLNCVGAIDDNLLVARPVQYVDVFPDFLLVDDWVGYILGLRY